ncbi:hypothetical protein CNO18_04615 [Gordonia sp. 1D]|nr:hypothetical protein CNO18_04615 [Gordonia sp. 1D]
MLRRRPQRLRVGEPLFEIGAFLDRGADLLEQSLQLFGVFGHAIPSTAPDQVNCSGAMMPPRV